MTPDDAVAQVTAALEKALESIDREVETAKERAEEAKREHEALRAPPQSARPPSRDAVAMALGECVDLIELRPAEIDPERGGFIASRLGEWIIRSHAPRIAHVADASVGTAWVREGRFADVD